MPSQSPSSTKQARPQCQQLSCQICWCCHSRSMYMLQGGLDTLVFQLSQLLHEEGWIVYRRQLPLWAKVQWVHSLPKDMVEIHGYNEHISVTGEDSNLCHATLSENMNSVRNCSEFGLFMVGVKVWVLEHFSILYQLCGCWCFIAHYLTQDDEKIIRMCCEEVHYESLYELFQFDFVCCWWPKTVHISW